jgi:hypothetical protein
VRNVAIVALAGALLASAATAAVAGEATPVDLGDAPDGTSARYSGKPAVTGSFPSKAGPRLGAGGPRLGTGWNAESASRQVDRDADDGGGLQPRSCGVSTLDVALDLSRVEPGAPVYVNAWFDWNQDGHWADGGNATCGPEWGVQNERVDRAALGGSGIGVVRLRFRAGRMPSEFWWRLQVHAGAPAPHAAGAGTTGAGEIEDFREGATDVPGEPELTCRRMLLPHGRVPPGGGGPPSMDFYLVAPGLGARISRPSVVVRLTGETDGIRLATYRHADFVEVVIGSTQHTRKQVLQRARIEVVARAVWPGGNAIVRARCPLYVIHSKAVARPYRAARITTPAVRVVVDPDKPTPQSARCAARMDDGLVYFRVRTVCRGADVKSTSVWSSVEPVGVWSGEWPRPFLDRCTPRFTGTNALKCYWKPGNKGRLLELRVNTKSTERARYQVVVLAGGHGEGGTAIVFEQTWYALGGGQFRCLQTVPRAASCILAPARGG